MIKVGIVGATGFVGAELIRILMAHPEAEIAAISSVSFEGQPVSAVYPAYARLCDQTCETEDAVLGESDVIFAALPHGLSQPLAARCREEGKILIDLGADFRLQSEEDYATWYGGAFDDAALHKEAAYGLPELFRESIRGKNLIANPGCYTTAAPLALAPALAAGLIERDGIVIDAKSGVTGAGREATQTTHFVSCNEDLSPYKIAAHRHTPEMEQTLSRVADEPIRVTFVPHLLPINRGILATCYARLQTGASEAGIRAAYGEFYQNEPFIRLLPCGQTARIRAVKYSNLCDISLHVDQRTGTLVAVSAIDNMVKGAAGQAVQNMNIVTELPETTGLMTLPPAF